MNNFFRWIYFNVLKWELVGQMPKIDKMVLPVVPHTHWYDFLLGILIRNVINEEINFVGKKEIFGPVLSIIPFDTEEDAVRIGNDIDFGLAAGVWTNDIGRALRMSEKLRAGTIWVNTYRAVSFTSPFGGYKRSGEGRESGKDAIKEFLQVKSVWIAQQTTTENPFIMR